MTRNIMFSVSLTLLAAACGDAQLSNPPALEVVFLPLHNARDVDPHVTPSAYFSAAVDPASLNDETAFLRTTGWSCADPQDATTCACSVEWSPVTGQAEVDENDPTLVLFSGDDLLAKHCYLLVFTTAVRGVEHGPLAALGLPPEHLANYDLPADLQVGALEEFWTAQ